MTSSTVALLLTLLLAAVVAVGLAAALAIDYLLTEQPGTRYRAQATASTYRTGGAR